VTALEAVRRSIYDGEGRSQDGGTVGLQ